MPEIVSINPATEEINQKFELTDEKTATKQVMQARYSSKISKEEPIEDRLVLLKEVAKILNKRSKRYGEIITKEMGKPITQAVAEVEKCASVCEYYAKNAEKFLADEKIEVDGTNAYTSYEPLGTIMGIMPWNFPFWQVLRFAAPTIAAGNSIVVKHASNVPICAKEIEDVFLEAGFRKGTYTNLVISSSVATALVDKNLVEGISFTGSTEIGSKIGEMAGRNIKKVVLELGGSDPYIVLNGADVEKAAQMAVTARFQNCGQSCVAAKRFIIDREITEEFTSELLAGIDNLVMGDPSDSKTTLGPMARADLRKELANQLQEMKNEGAKVLTGGKMPSRKGYYFEPTVIESNKKSEAAMKETFGPVATIMIAKDIDEAIEIANMTEYGLGASLWTNDKSETLVRKIDAGFVVVNNMVKSDPAVPFGGIKRSGLGRELGKEGIYEFVNKKSVLIN